MSAPDSLEKFSGPLPQPDDDLVAAFWEHCARGELRFQRCSGCGTWRHLPRLRCARCGSPEFSWERSSGRGRVHSWTVTHQTPIRAFAARAPFAVLVVELDEGVRMVAGLVEADPKVLRLELPVEVVFERVSPEWALPQFRPAGRK
ncbi:MAG: Zn-ribbon domain-containing OB-fold protein [Myxococcota bacterium]